MNHDKKKNIIIQCIAEFVGTGLIMFFGIGCLAASKLTYMHFNQFEISCIWGTAVSIAIYFSSAISGAHLNPAITIFFWLSDKFNKKKVLPYIISQLLGSFCFTILIYYCYNNALLEFENKNNIIIGTQESFQLVSIFCVYPNFNKSFIHNSLIEIFTDAIFMLMLLQLHHIKKKKFLFNRTIVPIIIGILVLMINVSMSPVYNVSLNPARDLGPKIFLSLIGWGIFSFTGGDHNFLYVLIPIVGPIVGINLGGWMHKILIEKSFFKI